MSYADLPTEELVRLCVKGDATAWEEFVRRFDKMIAAVVARVARRFGDFSTTTREDLVQETYFKICAENCRFLRQFEFRHPDSFLGMLRVTARNLAIDHFRRKKQEFDKVVSNLEDVEQFVADGHATGQTERAALLNQIEQLLIAICASPTGQRDRTIFYLYFRYGLTAKAIASIAVFGLTTKGVESTLHRLMKELRERL